MKISRRLFSLGLTLFLFVCCMSITVFADDGSTMYGIGFVNATALRLRKNADTTSQIVATAYQNECVVIKSQEGDWYRVLYNLQEGYMHKDYLTVSTVENAELGYGKVTGTTVNLRSGPSTDSSRIGSASKDEKCYILGMNNGWYKVIHGSNIGYIRSDYLELTEVPYENRASSVSPKYFRLGKSIGPAPGASSQNGNAAAKPSNVTGDMIVSKAKQYLGTPYVYGGASPSGFDCSGFVYYVLSQLGYSVARTPAAQISIGTPVAKSELKPGDIVFFAGTGGASGISHVGIYVGNGQFIHSPNSRSVVSFADLTSGYWSTYYYGARRVV